MKNISVLIIGLFLVLVTPFLANAQEEQGAQENMVAPVVADAQQAQPDVVEPVVADAQEAPQAVAEPVLAETPETAQIIEAPVLADAQEAQEKKDGWNYTLGTFFWAADADVTLDSDSGHSVSGTVPFDDVIKNVTPSINVMFAAQKDKLSLHASFFNLFLSDDLAARTGGERTTKITLFIPELYGAYDVVDTKLGDSLNLTLSPLAGARYYYGRFQLDNVGGGEARDTHKDTTDAIVGLLAKLDIGSKMAIKARGDVGGFGWGDSHDESYFLMGAFDWKYAKNKTLSLGYADLYFKNEDLGNTGNLTSEINFRGPIMSHTFQF